MAYSYNLGEMMHSYIPKNGYSIYEISKKAEVNRTTLQKVLTNERKLTKPMLDKLRPYLKLTPSEYSDLVLMIGETKKGKAEIENFNFIKHMIESVYESSYAKEAMNRYKLSVAHDVKDYKKELFVGRIAIEGLIHELLHLEYKKELPSIKVYIPNPDKPEKLIIISSPFYVTIKKKGVFICYLQISIPTKSTVPLPAMTA